MTLTALIILGVVVAALWRLARLVIRLALITAIVAVGGWYLHQHPLTPRSGLGPPATRQVKRDVNREVQNLTGEHLEGVLRRLTSGQTSTRDRHR
jgi:hypothetical protein